MDFPYVLDFFLDFAYAIALLHFRRRDTRVLSKFPLKYPQKSKSELGRWISPYVFAFFLDFAYEIALLHFCRREAQGT